MAPMVTPGDPQAAPRSGAWIDGMVQHQTGVLRISAFGFGFGFDIGMPGVGQWLKAWYNNNGPLKARGRRQPLACFKAALCRNRSHRPLPGCSCSWGRSRNRKCSVIRSGR